VNGDILDAWPMTELHGFCKGPLRRIGAVLRPAVSLLLVMTILYIMDWGKLWDALAKLSVRACLTSGLVIAMAQIVNGLRWYIMIRRLSTRSFWWHLRHYAFAIFLNSFTPANIGGDLYRLVALRRSGRGTLEAASLLLRERYFGLFGYCCFFMICIAGLLVGGDGIPVDLTSSSWVIGGILLTLAFLSQILRVSERILRFIPSLRDRLIPLFARTRQAVAIPFDRRFVACLALTLLNVTCWALASMVVCRDLGIDVSYWAIGAVAVLVELARWIPISVQGIGVREGLYSVLLGLFGVSAANGFVAGGVLYIILGVVLILAGAVAAAVGLINRDLKHMTA
jgi:uncharacterized protein (TIRG00374 family)